MNVLQRSPWFKYIIFKLCNISDQNFNFYQIYKCMAPLWRGACLLRLFWLTSSRVTFSDKIHMRPSLLEKDGSFYSHGSLRTLLQNFKAYMEEQNVNFPSNFSLHIFQQFCKVIQEKINLTGCQSRISAKINRWSCRSSEAREVAQAEEPTLQKALSTYLWMPCPAEGSHTRNPRILEYSKL